MKIHKNSPLFRLPLLKRYSGIVLGRHAFFKGEPTEPIIRHEEIHQEQMTRVGVGMFYLIYLKDYVKGFVTYWNHDAAYLSIPFEKEAYTKMWRG